MRALTGTLLLALISSPLWSACSPRHAECSCFGGDGLTLHAQTGAVSAIHLSGVACSDAQLRCVPMDVSSQFTAGCDEYQIVPRRGGTCVVHVDLSNGASFDTSAEMLDTSSEPCCMGVYAKGGPDVTVPFAPTGDAAPE